MLYEPEPGKTEISHVPAAVSPDRGEPREAVPLSVGWESPAGGESDAAV